MLIKIKFGGTKISVENLFFYQSKSCVFQCKSVSICRLCGKKKMQNEPNLQNA